MALLLVIMELTTAVLEKQLAMFHCKDLALLLVMIILLITVVMFLFLEHGGVTCAL